MVLNPINMKKKKKKGVMRARNLLHAPFPPERRLDLLPPGNGEEEEGHKASTHVMSPIGR